ncbi:NMDA receptor-regulated protein 1-domain-containing protein [Spinellus fusiger]|nr:NMDA receptor-regulated protein 1-domain-containing protein [Spinellus fusiger]
MPSHSFFLSSKRAHKHFWILTTHNHLHQDHYEKEYFVAGFLLLNTFSEKYPEHGEAWSMKGLFLWHLGYKDQSYECCKKGIEYHPEAPTCWRNYGFLLAKDSKMNESYQYYKKAVALDNYSDPESLHEMACLQTHLRLYQEAMDTRTKLVVLLPEEPSFWIGLAVACHGANQPDKAIKALESYYASKEVSRTSSAYEESEVLLFHTQLLKQQEKYQEALDHLDLFESQITDTKKLKEYRALLLVHRGRKEEAEAIYRQLIQENPYTKNYIDSLLNLQCNDKDKQLWANRLLPMLANEYPRSTTIIDMMLHYTLPAQFKEQVESILQDHLRKGIPSFFARMKSHYKETEKQTIIENLVLEYAESLQCISQFSTDGGEVKEQNSTLAWTFHYLSRHYDFLGQLEKALTYIQQAIQQDPTIVEFHMVHARIKKHQGDLETAARIMNKARTLDLKDRFVNSKCVKYMLRAGYIYKAKEILLLFIKDRFNTKEYLTYLQYQWFIIEEGFAYLKIHDYSRALDRFQNVVSFYKDFKDNEYGFHSFCLEKYTLQTYTELLQWEDKICSHPYYFKAMKGLIQTYLAIDAERKKDKGLCQNIDPKEPHGKPFLFIITLNSSFYLLFLFITDVSLIVNKIKQINVSAVDDEDFNIKPDSETLSETYVESTTPLEDALKSLVTLQSMAPDSIDTHLFSFDVYLCKEQWLLARKSLLAMSQINKSHPSLQMSIERFKAAGKEKIVNL